MIKSPIILIALFSIILPKYSFSQTAQKIIENNWVWHAIGVDKISQPFVLKKQIKVAIIDDGFDIENPLWMNNIAVNEKEIPGNNIDDDKNGKTDDFQGWDFGDNDEDVKPDIKNVDKQVHGTKVLGVFWQTLQQCVGNAISTIHILPIKAVSDIKMNNYVMEGYKGIEYAIEQNADIIICSWSGPSISDEEKKILEKAAAKKILIIASAGNFYALTPQYPGAFNSVINVAATDKGNKKIKLSNYGMHVDISAPGDSLLTYYPYKKNADAFLSATSAATPVVAAVVTVISSAYPSLPKNNIGPIIKNTAQPIDAVNPLYAGNLGAGLLNVVAIKNDIENKSGSKKIFKQAKGYVDLQSLQVNEPVKIVPFGKYKNIKFLAQAISNVQLSDVKVKIFSGGRSNDIVIKKDKLKYPFIVSADSLYIFKSVNNSKPSNIKSYWYYEVTTIDSSILYCSGTTNVSNAEGYIEDGSASDNYTGRNDCKWQLTAPAGKKFQLNFDEFDSEAKIDQVYIFNGNSTKDPILAIFSGPNIPPSITSWTNEVLIWFLTNEENNFKGWKLHYKIID